jgi:SAM-dependent methyltransferase
MLRPIAIVEEPPLFAAIVTPPAEPAARRARAPRRFAEVALETRAPRRRARRTPRPPSRTAAPAAAGATIRPPHLDGAPVAMVTINDPHALPAHEQLVADGLVAELEAQARRARRSGYEGCSGLYHAERYPSLPQWLALRGSGLALHPLYRPSQARRLVHGFGFSDFLAPLFDGESAVDVLRALLGAERAAPVIERHRVFCETPMTDEARLLLGGTIDARAVRQRALIATHTIAAGRSRWSGGARIAAVGAGAGEAVAQIAASLDASSLTLIDRDPMALAAASVVTRERVPGLRVHAALARRGAVAELATAGRFDVIDLTCALGALPDGAVVELLRGARRVLRPGGIVVAASMLDRRPQQTLFDDVLRWPAVSQRSAPALAGLIEAAGFPPSQVSLAIPATAPVHVIATIDTAV